MNNRGKLYGTGVGPGDPELITVKALRIMKECDVIAVPCRSDGSSTAYSIAEKAFPEISRKEVLRLYVPMTKKPDLSEQNYVNSAGKIMSVLDEGKNVAFLTLGDPTVYSTYIYVHRIVSAAGYSTEIISGITSFCAAAARLNDSIADRSEQIHIIPGSYDFENAASLSGTKIIMKAGSSMDKVNSWLSGTECTAALVQNCGKDGEKIIRDKKDFTGEEGYFSVIIVRNK